MTVEQEPFILITLQMHADRSLIIDGQIASWPAFLGRLDSLRQRHRLRVKPHPYSPIPEAFATWLRNSPDVILSTDNIYDLLCSPHLKLVVSLSSSTLLEAAAFGVDTDRLLPTQDQWSFLDRPAADGWRSIFNKHNDRMFWKKLLEGLIGDDTQSQEQLTTGGDTLRRIFGQTWGWQPDATATPAPKP